MRELRSSVWFRGTLVLATLASGSALWCAIVLWRGATQVALMTPADSRPITTTPSATR